MKKPTDNPIVQRIDAILEERGLTRAAASRLAKLSPDYIRKLAENPESAGNVAKLGMLATALGVPLGRLTGEMVDGLPPDPTSIVRGEVRTAPVRAPNALAPRDLPVLGTAAGSLVGAFQFTRDVIDYVRRPPALEGVTEAYGLYVENESMSPMYRPGELIFVHPRRPVLKGDAIVIQVKRSAIDDMEAYIKIFSGKNAEWLVAEQLNPPGTLRYKLDTVAYIHKVLTMNDLFGV